MRYILTAIILATSAALAQQPQFRPPTTEALLFFQPKQQGHDTVITTRVKDLPDAVTNKAWVIPTLNGKMHGRAVAYHPNGDTAGVYNLHQGFPVGKVWHANPCDLSEKPDPFTNYCGILLYYSQPGNLDSTYRFFPDSRNNPRVIMKSRFDGNAEHGETELYLMDGRKFYSLNYYHGLPDGWAWRVQQDSAQTHTDSVRWVMGRAYKP